MKWVGLNLFFNLKHVLHLHSILHIGVLTDSVSFGITLLLSNIYITELLCNNILLFDGFLVNLVSLCFSIISCNKRTHIPKNNNNNMP